MYVVWHTHTHMCEAGRKALCSWPAVMHVNVGHLKSYKHSPTQIPFLFLLLLHHSMRFSPASFSAINWQPADADVFQICTVPFATYTHIQTHRSIFTMFFLGTRALIVPSAPFIRTGIFVKSWQTECETVSMSMSRWTAQNGCNYAMPVGRQAR